MSQVSEAAVAKFNELCRETDPDWQDCSAVKLTSHRAFTKYIQHVSDTVDAYIEGGGADVCDALSALVLPKEQDWAREVMAAELRSTFGTPDAVVDALIARLAKRGWELRKREKD